MFVDKYLDFCRSKIQSGRFIQFIPMVDIYVQFSVKQYKRNLNVNLQPNWFYSIISQAESSAFSEELVVVGSLVSARSSHLQCSVHCTEYFVSVRNNVIIISGLYEQAHCITSAKTNCNFENIILMLFYKSQSERTSPM